MKKGKRLNPIMIMVSGAVLVNPSANVTQGNAIVRAIGVNPASPVSGKVQQHNLIAAQQNSYQKGTQFSITASYSYPGSGNAGDLTGYFRLFDFLGCALNSGAHDNVATYTVLTSTFMGGGSSATTAAAIAKAYFGGSRVGSVGTVMTWGSSSYVSSTNLQVWNGNIQQYTSQSMQDFLTLGQNTFAQNQAQLTINTALWLNSFFAITGVLPNPGSGNAPTTFSVLFNVCTHGNF